MRSRGSVVIIGGGVIGLSIALHAIRKGFRVTVVERGAPDGDRCSLGNAGLIVPSHVVPLAAPGMVSMALRMMRDAESPFRLRPRPSLELLGWCWRFLRSATRAHVERSAPRLRDLSLASRALHEELASEAAGEYALEKRGLLLWCAGEHAFAEETEAARKVRALGLPAEVLTAAEAARLEPAFRARAAGAVYHPLDAHLDPARFWSWLVHTLVRRGAIFAWSTEAVGWRTAGSRVLALRTRNGDLEADEFVLAAGAWSPGLARGLGARLPIQAGKGYSLTVDRPRALPTIPSILVEGRVAVTPMGSSLRFAGTMEIAGLDAAVDPARIRGIVKSVNHFYPDTTAGDFEGIAAWSGLRPCSPDGIPYVGRFREWKNLTAATGHAMLGLSLGPITGKLVAEILAGETPSVSLAGMEPDRFDG